MYNFALQHRSRIIFFYKIFCILLGIFYAYGAFIVLSKSSQAVIFYDLGLYFGRAALILFCLVISVGTFYRFGLTWAILNLIKVFRRQLGITVFLFALIHFSFVRFFPSFPVISSLQIFEMMGLIALSIMFFLFLTSNNYSVRLLKKNWKLLHRTIYIVAWLLFLHTALQAISIWSIFIGTCALLETISLLYSYVRFKKI